MTHSPLPWKLADDLLIESADKCVVLGDAGHGDSELIVKCVNAHDDLVAALKLIAVTDSRRYGDDMIHGEFCDIAKAALTKHGIA